MKFGYIRVSTSKQNLDVQINEIKKNGVPEENLYIDKITGSKKNRPALNRLIELLRPNDEIYIYKLDRLARSLKDLIELLNFFDSKKVNVIFLKDNINTGTSQGRLIFHILGSLAEFERELISERTKAGLEAAKKRGRFPGRKKGLSPEALKKAKYAAKLYQNKNLKIEEIMKLAGIKSKATLYKYLRNQKML